jgi:hypothetical protein
MIYSLGGFEEEQMSEKSFCHPPRISKVRPRLRTPPRRRFPAHSPPPVAPSGASKGAHFAKGLKSIDTATLTTFRINTCKSVSKQRTLTTFRMNTYVKRGEGGTRAKTLVLVTRSPRSVHEIIRRLNGLAAKGTFGKHFQGLARISTQVPAGNTMPPRRPGLGREKPRHERSNPTTH